MKDSTNDIQLIEKFLEGKMTGEEKKEFETRLNQDQSFQAMMTDLRMLVEGIKTSAAQTAREEKIDRLKFFAEINEIENGETLETLVAEAKVVPLYRKPWMLAAASLLILASLTAYFMREQTPLNEKLYTAYFEAFDSPGSSMTRGGEISVITPKTQAYEAYDNGNYKVAAQLFEKIIKEKEDAVSQLCLGNAYLAQNDLANAEKTFIELVARHGELITQAKWYLALTYLKENKMERAKSTLWEISKSSTYGEKAQKLLEELD